MGVRLFHEQHCWTGSPAKSLLTIVSLLVDPGIFPRQLFFTHSATCGTPQGRWEELLCFQSTASLLGLLSHWAPGMRGYPLLGTSPSLFSAAIARGTVRGRTGGDGVASHTEASKEVPERGYAAPVAPQRTSRTPQGGLPWLPWI